MICQDSDHPFVEKITEILYATEVKNRKKKINGLHFIFKINLNGH